ncbi:hypothetical protein EMCRGX_G006135 [Ephydatia muelleri]
MREGTEHPGRQVHGARHSTCHSQNRKTSNVDQISGYCDIDTEVGELRLPDDKVVHLRSLVADWAGRKACNRKELESLVGHLNHACKVVRPGRSFLRRMIALLQQYRNKYHPIRLNHGFRSDLHWWASFAAQWNGTSYIATGVQVRFATDASGNWGCGAWHQRSWFQWKWDDVTRLLAIAVKELLPIILATLVPQANKEPARVPQAAVDLLIIRDEGNEGREQDQLTSQPCLQQTPITVSVPVEDETTRREHRSQEGVEPTTSNGMSVRAPEVSVDASSNLGSGGTMLPCRRSTRISKAPKRFSEEFT